MTRLLKVVLFVVLAFTIATTALAANRNFRTHLSGQFEVPVRDTRAQGQAIFQLSKDGKSLHYKLIVANIENVVAAHIHLGAPEVNGPVVAFLYGNVAPGGGRVNGVLSEGTITTDNLINDLSGDPLSALMAEIERGNAYVNVHTNDGSGENNTGPGNFQSGEIRGNLP